MANLKDVNIENIKLKELVEFLMKIQVKFPFAYKLIFQNKGVILLNETKN